MNKMNATVSHNTQRNGVEIRFDLRPPDTVLAWLHENKFRWSRRQKVWYKTFSQGDYNKAVEKFKGHATMPSSPAPPKPEPKVVKDKAYWAKHEIAQLQKGSVNFSSIYYMALLPFAEWYKRFKGKNIQVGEREFVWDIKKGLWTYLPPKRKRPDKYHPFNLHDIICRIALKNGMIIPWQVILSNPAYHSKTRSHFNYTLKAYPQLEFADDYDQTKKEMQQIEDQHHIIFNHWQTIRDKYVKKGQVVWMQDKDSKKWENWVVQQIGVSDHGPGYIYHTVHLQKDHGWITFQGEQSMKRIYTEDPTKNTQAKPLYDQLTDTERDPLVKKPSDPDFTKKKAAKAKAKARLRLIKIKQRARLQQTQTDKPKDPLEQLKGAIYQTMNKLIARAKRKGLYENFGQKELRDLEDKFIDISDYSDEMNKKRDILNQFDEWAMNFTGR